MKSVSENEPSMYNLSKRELEVLRLVASGMTNKQIAIELCVTERTVRSHLENILRKMNVNNRVEAVMKALKDDLFML
jgi:DNA-binding NarL/FixJ family response regulator